MSVPRLPPVDRLGEFLEWCEMQASSETCRKYATYLEAGCKDLGNRWCAKAWKKYLRYLCEEEEDAEACRLYKRIKIPRSGVDIYVPSDEEVLGAMRDPRYGWLYRILVESGLRLEEAARLVAGKPRCVRVDGFVRCELNWSRGAKRALWAYLLEEPSPQQPVGGHVLARRLSAYAYKRGLPAPKYIRKWVAMKMIALGIPESVVDFIQGRVPSKILAVHYLDLLVQADKHYPKYAQWLRSSLQTSA